jgi:hypothetical protein
MRRVAFAIVGTIAGLVGLLSFKTHSASVANPPAAIALPVEHIRRDAEHRERTVDPERSRLVVEYGYRRRR